MTEEQVKLFEDNIKLVYSIANKYRSVISNLPDMGFEDLVSEGYVGLVKVCKNFKPELGFKFSTFAYPSIEGYILRFIRDHSGDIKFTRRAKDMANLISKNNIDIEDMSVSEISQKLNMPERDIEEGIECLLIRRSSSMDASIGSVDDEKLTFLDLMTSDIGNPEDCLNNLMLEEFRSKLTEKEGQVLDLLLKGVTQSAIAERLGITQSYVSRVNRKIYNKALKMNGQEPVKSVAGEVSASKKKRAEQEKIVRREKEMSKIEDLTARASKELLEDLVSEGLTNGQIASKVGVYAGDIAYLKRYYGISRGRKSPRKGSATVPDKAEVVTVMDGREGKAESYLEMSFEEKVEEMRSVVSSKIMLYGSELKSEEQPKPQPPEQKPEIIVEDTRKVFSGENFDPTPSFEQEDKPPTRSVVDEVSIKDLLEGLKSLSTVGNIVIGNLNITING